MGKSEKRLKYLKRIQEDEEEKEEKKKKLKSEDFRNIMTVVIAFFALIVSLISLNRNNAMSTPKFSLEVLKDDDSENLNRTFKLYNVGGQIVNPKIKPKLQVELTCNVCDENGDAEREGIVLIEFSDYFSDDYFYNNDESSFIISEKYANELFDLIDKIEKDLREENDCINLYAIKYYFEVSYYNYKGTKKNITLYPTSNFAMLDYQNSARTRYFRDIELKEIKNIKEADITLSLNFYKGSALIINREDDSEEVSCYEGTGSTYDIISNFIKDNLKEKSVELDIKNIDDDLYAREVTKKNVKDIIKDDNEFIIGLMEDYEKEKRMMLIIFSILFLSILLSCFYVFKGVRKSKK